MHFESSISSSSRANPSARSNSRISSFEQESPVRCSTRKPSLVIPIRIHDGIAKYSVGFAPVRTALEEFLARFRSILWRETGKSLLWLGAARYRTALDFSMCGAIANIGQICDSGKKLGVTHAKVYELLGDPPTKMLVSICEPKEITAVLRIMHLGRGIFQCIWITVTRR